MQLNHITYFRGIAICLIVLLHVVLLMRYPIDTFSDKLFFNAISGGTTLFVFISGYLFHHIFYTRGLHMPRFMRSKFNHVYTPYLFIATPVFIYQIIRGIQGFRDIDFFLDMGAKMLSGTILGATWYIPFVMLIFLCSPLFVHFIEMRRYRRRILFVGFLSASFTHRPEITPLFNIFHAWVYYVPFYMLGIYASIHKEILDDKFRFYWKRLLLCWFLIVILQTQMGTFGNLHKPFWQYAGFDWMVPQKLLQIGACYGMCLYLVDAGNSATKQWLQQIISSLAAYSFGIFFLHNYALFLLSLVYASGQRPGAGMWAVLMMTVIICVGSIFICKILQYLLGNRSRRVVGC